MEIKVREDRSGLKLQDVFLGQSKEPEKSSEGFPWVFDEYRDLLTKNETPQSQANSQWKVIGWTSPSADKEQKIFELQQEW